MLVLGIETSGDAAGCAVGIRDDKTFETKILFASEITEPQRHCENLAPLILSSIKEAKINLKDLGLIAVDIGPGLYTGLRVGITTAMFLAYGLNLPTLGVSSLDLLAFQDHQQEQSKKEESEGKGQKDEVDWVIPILDARRGEVFYAWHRQVDLEADNFDIITGRSVAGPEDLGGYLRTETQMGSPKIRCVGDMAVQHKDIFEFAGCQVRPGIPTPAGLVELAGRAPLAMYVLAGELRPLYLRKPDAVSKGVAGK